MSTQPIIYKHMPWCDKVRFCSEISGGLWVNNKTNKIVTVIGKVGLNRLRIKHENGRVTEKQAHYFVGDYSTNIKKEKSAQ